eukprot:9058118-Pyramimonas_sp.AAC.1
MPVFVSFDVKAAFPGMNQIWLGRVLSRFHIPTPYIHAIRALMCGAVGILRWDRSPESFPPSPQ